MIQGKQKTALPVGAGKAAVETGITDNRMVPVRSCESLSGTVNSRRL